MKVVLVKDVKGIGHAHDTREVSDGYALNYLIPQEFAVFATDSAVKNAETHKSKTAKERTVQTALFEENLKKLAESKVVITAKVNEKGHLYDAINAPEIVAALKEKLNVLIDEEAIKLEKPIKEVGTFTIPVSSGETFGSFEIEVAGEE